MTIHDNGRSGEALFAIPRRGSAAAERRQRKARSTSVSGQRRRRNTATVRAQDSDQGARCTARSTRSVAGAQGAGMRADSARLDGHFCTDVPRKARRGGVSVNNSLLGDAQGSTDDSYPPNAFCTCSRTCVPITEARAEVLRWSDSARELLVDLPDIPRRVVRWTRYAIWSWPGPADGTITKSSYDGHQRQLRSPTTSPVWLPVDTAAGRRSMGRRRRGV